MRHAILGKPTVDVFADADKHPWRESAFGEILAIGRYSRGATPADGLYRACIAVERGDDGDQIAGLAMLNGTAGFHDLAADLVSRHAGKGCER